MRQFVFWIRYKLWATDSLRGVTWDKLKADNPDLYAFKESGLGRFWRKVLSNHKYAFSVFIITPLLFCLFFIFEFQGLFPDFLCFIKMNEVLAIDAVKNNLSNAATLIGVSFVVLGFIFEIVRDKTHQTFMELASSVSLFPVMGLSFSVILFHVLCNPLINTLADIKGIGYMVNNLGLCSWYMMIAFLGGLIFLFLKLTRIFSMEAINQHFRKALLREAKGVALQETFIKKSRELYISELINLGLKIHTVKWDGIQNQRALHLATATREIYDVRISKLKTLLSRLAVWSDSSTEFAPIQLDTAHNSDSDIFFVPENLVAEIDKSIHSTFFLLRKSDSSTNYLSQKRNLVEHLQEAVSQGNIKQLKEQLDCMREVYSVLYKSLDKND